MHLTRFHWSALFLGAVSVGCSSSVEPTLRMNSVEMVLGDGQTGTIGEALPLPLIVRVTGRSGAAARAVAVTFRVTSGDGAFDASGVGQPCRPLFPNEVVLTNDDGYAWVSLLPLSFEPLMVAAEVPHGQGPPLTFAAEATDPGASLSIVSGDNQEGPTGERLGDSFVARLTSGQGDPIAGVAMVWEVTSGEGILRRGLGCDDLDTVPTTLTVRTLADGTTGPSGNGVEFVPTVYGISTVSASVPGVLGSPLTFMVDATTQSIWLANPYIGPGFAPADVTVPVGATVEWSNANPSARIVSTSAPVGGTAFDSGPIGENGGFRFVPDVAGTWEYMDEVSGQKGTLTAT